MNFPAFLSYTFLTAYTPGPNNLLSMTNASRDGFKRSIPFFFGIFTGFVVVMSACAIFSSLLFDLIPAIKPYMVILGAGYILFLAWTVLRDRPHKGKTGITQGNSFLSGMLLQFVNVKIILYGITAMSSYILPYYANSKRSGNSVICNAPSNWVILLLVSVSVSEKHPPKRPFLAYRLRPVGR